jgi:hypothetical protein
LAAFSKEEQAAVEKIQTLTASDYIKLLEANPPTEKQWAMLKFHHSSPEHTATARELAAHAGYATPQAANLQYGTFAGKFCSRLKVKPPNNIAMFVTFLKPEGEEWRLIMRSALVKALDQLIKKQAKGK